MTARLASLFSNDDGPVAAEYALIIALIAIAIIAALFLLGGSLSGVFNYLGNQFGPFSAVGPPPSVL